MPVPDVLAEVLVFRRLNTGPKDWGVSFRDIGSGADCLVEQAPPWVLTTPRIPPSLPIPP
jgi:hypothetical protein